MLDYISERINERERPRMNLWPLFPYVAGTLIWAFVVAVMLFS